MKAYELRIDGMQTTAFYDGAHYVFINSFYGILAIANRNYEETYQAEAKTKFALLHGNSNLSAYDNEKVLEDVKSFIESKESMYVKTEVTYDATPVDCDRKASVSLNVEMKM